MPYAEGKKVIQILEQNWSLAVTRGHTMAMVWPSAYSVALRLQRVPRALQGRVRVSRALHGREGRLTRLAPAPRALGGRAMSDDEQTQLETHAPMEGGAQLSHGPGTAAETGAAALAGAAEAVADPPATLRARMIVDLANFVPTVVEAKSGRNPVVFGPVKSGFFGF